MSINFYRRCHPFTCKESKIFVKILKEKSTNRHDLISIFVDPLEVFFPIWISFAYQNTSEPMVSERIFSFQCCRITKYVQEVYWLYEYKIAFFIFLLKFLFVLPRHASSIVCTLCLILYRFTWSYWSEPHTHTHTAELNCCREWVS